MGRGAVSAAPLMQPRGPAAFETSLLLDTPEVTFDPLDSLGKASGSGSSGGMFGGMVLTGSGARPAAAPSQQPQQPMAAAAHAIPPSFSSTPQMLTPLSAPVAPTQSPLSAGSAFPGLGGTSSTATRSGSFGMAGLAPANPMMGMPGMMGASAYPTGMPMFVPMGNAGYPGMGMQPGMVAMQPGMVPMQAGMMGAPMGYSMPAMGGGNMGGAGFGMMPGGMGAGGYGGMGGMGAPLQRTGSDAAGMGAARAAATTAGNKSGAMPSGFGFMKGGDAFGFVSAEVDRNRLK